MRRRLSLPQLQPSRRGSLFHYYMMYLLLTSVLMTSAGLCIHTVLKADRVDAEESRHLNSLLSLEQQIRRDSADANSVEAADDRMTLNSANGHRVEWKVASSTVIREEKDRDTLSTSNRFIFRRGTQLSFAAAEKSGVTFRLIEATSKAKEGNAVAEPKAVEILLFPGSDTGEDSSGLEPSSVEVTADDKNSDASTEGGTE